MVIEGACVGDVLPVACGGPLPPIILKSFLDVAYVVGKVEGLFEGD